MKVRYFIVMSSAEKPDPGLVRITARGIKTVNGMIFSVKHTAEILGSIPDRCPGIGGSIRLPILIIGMITV